MEEHGMFIETSVVENERNEHETYLRLAITVRNYQLEFNKFDRFFQLAEENVEHGLGGPFGGKYFLHFIIQKNNIVFFSGRL